jgi:hypothetical protein
LPTRSDKLCGYGGTDENLVVGGKPQYVNR